MDKKYHTPSRLIVLASITFIVLSQAWGSGVKPARADVPPVPPPQATATKIPRTPIARPSPTPVPRRAGPRTSRAARDSVSYTLLTENFDASDTLPTNWITSTVVGSNGFWKIEEVAPHPGYVTAHSLPHLVRFNSFDAYEWEEVRLYSTTSLDFRARSNISLTFWMYHNPEVPQDPETGAYDHVQVQVSTDHGLSWLSYGEVVRYLGADVNEWRQHTIDITAAGGHADSLVAILGISGWGDDCNIDDISVTAESIQLYLPFISKQ